MSVWGLAQTHHVACPDICEELGLPVALLVKKLADGGDMALEQVLEVLSGINTAWAIKNGMVLILYRFITVIV